MPQIILRQKKLAHGLNRGLAKNGTTYGTRTRDSSVKGRRLNLLTNAALISEGKDTVDTLLFQTFLENTFKYPLFKQKSSTLILFPGDEWEFLHLKTPF